MPPEWRESHEYRVKPELKVAYGYVKGVRPDYPQGLSATGFCDVGPLQLTTEQTISDNIKFTFDGETGALKNVELLK